MNIVVLVILGLCLGSFVNALVWRLHEQSKPKKKRVAKDTELSIVKGRSMCPDCQHTLSTADLLPVLSWVTLGGKCRYCKASISWQYPVVEVMTALLFVASYCYWPITLQNLSLQTLQFAIWLGVVVIGMALVVYDFRWMLLPNRLVSIFGIFGAIFAAVNVLIIRDIPATLVQAALSVFIAGGIFYILYQVSDGKWIGGGDVKLGLVLGLFLGTPLNALLMLFLSSLLGCLYALSLVVVGKYKKGVHIPFGPFLLLATLIVVLFGAPIIALHESLILPR